MTIALGAYAGNATISSAAYSIPLHSTASAGLTDTGIFQFVIMSSAMLSGDQYEIKLIDSISSAGGQQAVYYYAILDGVQSQAIVTPAITLGYNWDLQIKQLAGGLRNFEWRITKIS